jgi:O-antigen/teichoic acid export membrane protein
MHIARRSLRGLAFMSASTLVNMLIGFFGGIVLARLLAPTDFGVFALASSVSLLIDLRAKFYLGQKYLSDPSATSETLDTLFTLDTILSALSLVLVLAAALVAALVFQRVDLALSLAVLGLLNQLTPLTSAINLSIEKEVSFGRVAFIQSIVGVAQFSTNLIGALAGLGLWSLLLGLAVSNILNVVLYLCIAPRVPRWRLNALECRAYLHYGIKYGLVFVTSGTILQQFDNVVVGVAGGVTALGYYDRAYRTSLWPSLLVSAALSRISLPTYTKVQNDPARLSKAFALVLWATFTLATPVMLIFFATANDLVLTLYGEKWLPVVPILQALAAFALGRMLLDDLISIMLATQRPGQLARLVFVQALVMMALIIPFTHFYGAVGAALSVGIAFMLSAGFLLYFAHKHLRISLWRSAGLPLLNNLLAIIIFLYVRPLLPTAEWAPTLRLIVESCSLLGLYVAISLMSSGQTIAGNMRYLARVARG